MLLLLLQYLQLYIGAFGPPVRVPSAAMTRKDGSVAGRIVPTKNLSFLVCHDSDTNLVHHFWHTNFTICRCAWAPRTPSVSKPLLFKQLRRWYEDVAGNLSTPLQIGVSDGEDLLAWHGDDFNGF